MGLLGFGCFLCVGLGCVEIGNSLEWVGVFWILVVCVEWAGVTECGSVWCEFGRCGGRVCCLVCGWWVVLSQCRFVGVGGCYVFAEGAVRRFFREEAWSGSVVPKVR